MKPQLPKVNGDNVQDTEWNSPVQENIKLVESTQQTLSATDDYQLSKAAAQYSAVGNYYVDTGTPNNYVVNAVSPRQGIPNLKTGQRIRFVATTTNTGASFINVQGTSSISLRDNGGALLIGGEVQVGARTTVEYDGTYWRLTDIGAALNALLYPVDGLTVSNNVSLPNTTLDFAVGKCADSNKNFLIKNTSAGFSKNMTLNWTAGSGNGGKASGISIIPSTFYYVFAVSKATGEVDFGIDNNINATNLLADTSASNYTKWRRIWTMYTLPGTPNIRLFKQYNNSCIYYQRLAATPDVSWGSPLNPSTPLYANLNVPTNIGVTAIIEFFLSGAPASGVDLRIFNSDQADINPNASNPIGLAGATVGKDRKGLEYIIPNASGQIIGRVNIIASAGLVYINTIGYQDFRTI